MACLFGRTRKGRAHGILEAWSVISTIPRRACIAKWTAWHSQVDSISSCTRAWNNIDVRGMGCIRAKTNLIPPETCVTVRHTCAPETCTGLPMGKQPTRSRPHINSAPERFNTEMLSSMARAKGSVRGRAQCATKHLQTTLSLSGLPEAGSTVAQKLSSGIVSCLYCVRPEAAHCTAM